MARKKLRNIAPIVIFLNCLLLSMIAVAGDKISNPEELVAKHLESLGTAQARSDVKSRADEGMVQFRVLSGGVGQIDGQSVLLSEGHKVLLMMKFPNTDYRGERFIFDGDRVEVRGSTPNQSRSTLGEFVYVQDAIIKEGLLGGALSTAWPLLKLDEHKAKLSYDGLKNIDGQQLHAVRYKPKKSTDLTIYLYFDPGTYRHVRTVYTLTIEPHIKSVPGNILQSPERGTPDNPGISEPGETAEIASARQFETRYRLEERFSNFTTADGLTLPTHYTVQFAREQQNGHTVLSQWDTAVNAIKQNVSPDPRNFTVK